ncbi:hypothetical protein RNZ50_21305 [Paracoccaceae bacterium Fryx2]|nr:hypothetical protein [Paracoccaceae bacterium Fryx2]
MTILQPLCRAPFTAWSVSLALALSQVSALPLHAQPLPRWALTPDQPMPDGIILAQSEGRDYNDRGNVGNWRSASDLSNVTATRVVSALKQAEDYCGWLPDVYVVDCLSDQYRNIQRSLPRAGDSSVLREILRVARVKLEGIAGQYEDPAARRAMPGESPPRFGTTATRPLRAVRQGSLPAARRAAQQVLAETQTLLLRSAESSAARKAHFTTIAQAVGSNSKVLLRA